VHLPSYRHFIFLLHRYFVLCGFSFLWLASHPHYRKQKLFIPHDTHLPMTTNNDFVYIFLLTVIRPRNKTNYVQYASLKRDKQILHCIGIKEVKKTLTYSLYKLWMCVGYVVRIVELKGKSFLQSSVCTERSIFSESKPSDKEMTLALNYFYMFNMETIYMRIIYVVRSTENTWLIHKKSTYFSQQLYWKLTQQV